MQIFHDTYYGQNAQEAYELFKKGLEQDDENSFYAMPPFEVRASQAAIAVDDFIEIKTEPFSIKGAEYQAKELLRDGLDLKGCYGAMPVGRDQDFVEDRQVLLTFENKGATYASHQEIIVEFFRQDQLAADEFIENIYVKGSKQTQQLTMQETSGQTTTRYYVLSAKMAVMWQAGGTDANGYDSFEQAKLAIEEYVKTKGNSNNAHHSYEIIGVVKRADSAPLATGAVEVLSNRRVYEVTVAKRLPSCQTEAYLFFAPVKAEVGEE